MKTITLSLIALGCALPLHAGEEFQTGEWRTLTDGATLKGWHISAASGHSGTSGHKSGGRWVVEDGAIIGSQDVPGNGGLIVTDEQFADFEVSVEMKNDFGPDSGLFLRSTEDGKAWQAMIDYHSGGNLMGVYGEGLGGKPHVRNYSFTDKVTEITTRPTGEPPIPLPVLPDAWPQFWRHGQWNELRARIVANPPEITTWINGVKIMEWKETEVRHQEKGHIALQVHGGGDHTKEFVRYRNVRVRTVEKKVADAGAGEERPDAVQTKSFKKEIEIAEPAAAPAKGGQTFVNIEADGSFRIAGTAVTREQLSARLQRIASVDAGMSIILRGDEGVEYGSVFAVLDLCHQAGLHSVSFAAQASKKQ